MTNARRNQLRSIMAMAWSFKRSEPARAFADCLRGAWKMIRGLSGFAKKAKWNRRAKVCLRSPILSPVEKALRSDPFGRDRARLASQVSGRLGR